MGNWIGLGFFILLVVGAIWALSTLGRPRPISSEEYERRVSAGTGLAGAGLLALQKALDPAAERAVETQADFKRGKYDKQQESGDDNDTPDGESMNDPELKR